MELERHSNGVMMVDVGVVVIVGTLAMECHLQAGGIKFFGPLGTIAIGRVVELLLVVHGGARHGHQPDVVMVGEASGLRIANGLGRGAEKGGKMKLKPRRRKKQRRKAERAGSRRRRGDAPMPRQARGGK